MNTGKKERIDEDVRKTLKARQDFSRERLEDRIAGRPVKESPVKRGGKTRRHKKKKHTKRR
jgi:hypothetical protein